MGKSIFQSRWQKLWLLIIVFWLQIRNLCKISLRTAPVARLEVLSASSYGWSKVKIECRSQCRIFRFGNENEHVNANVNANENVMNDAHTWLKGWWFQRIDPTAVDTADCGEIGARKCVYKPVFYMKIIYIIQPKLWFCILIIQVAPNWVKVAMDGNIFGNKTFFEVSLNIFYWRHDHVEGIWKVRLD